jgi:hypothetical protein
MVLCNDGTCVDSSPSKGMSVGVIIAIISGVLLFFAFLVRGFLFKKEKVE